MTTKDFALKRISKIIKDKVNIVYNVQRRKIFYRYTEFSNVMHDITDPLLALYYYFADNEDKLWREKFVNEKYHFVKDEMTQRVKCFFVDPVSENYTEVTTATKLELKKKKVYISGKITGLEEAEYKRNFNTAELWLTGLGYDVVNPVAYPPIPNGSWTDYMRRDIKLLMDCDYIYMLDGWTESTGAKTEFRLAVEIGIERLKLDPNGIMV